MRSIALLAPCAALLSFAGCFPRQDAGGGAEYDVLGIYVTPDTVVVPLGQTLQFTAWGLLDDRESTDLTSLAVWTSTNPAVAEVTGDRGGVVRGLSAGAATVYATYGGVESVPVDVTVTDAGLAKLTVSPDAVSIDQGSSVQLQATATFTDGSYADATTQVRWISADDGVASVSSGLLVGEGDGSTTVKAQWDDTVSNEVHVAVGDEANTGKADLLVSSASGSVSAGILSLSVAIGNQGTASASGFWVDIYIDPDGTPGNGDYGDDYTWISYVGADATESITFSTEVGAGSHEVWVLVDGTDEIDESNENNNLGATSVGSGGGSSSKANLAVTAFDWEVDGDELIYTASFENDGGTAAGRFYVDVFAHESTAPSPPADGDSWAEIASLAAGASESVEYSFTGSCEGCSSYLLLDSYDTVDEIDESDNVEGPLLVFF
jgi:hypothetical protein